MCAVAKAGIHGAAEVVDSLLRDVADEGSFDDGCSNTSGLIGEVFQEESRSFGDI